jgi:hypothetical protein
MKIYTASIRFDPIEDVTALRGIVRKQYLKNNPGRYAVVGDSLIVANSLTDDTDNVKKMGAIIGNTFNRQVDIHFGELNFNDFQNGERVATTPSVNPASAGDIGSK